MDFVPIVKKRMQLLNLKANALLILDKVPSHLEYSYSKYDSSGQVALNKRSSKTDCCF